MRPISRSEVMAELADVWEGNPRLTLYELFDVLRRAGLAPDSTNYEALSLCSYLTSLRPARVPLTPQGQATTPALVIMGTGRMRCALYPDYFGCTSPFAWSMMGVPNGATRTSRLLPSK